MRLSSSEECFASLFRYFVGMLGRDRPFTAGVMMSAGSSQVEEPAKRRQCGPRSQFQGKFQMGGASLIIEREYYISPQHQNNLAVYKLHMWRL